MSNLLIQWIPPPYVQNPLEAAVSSQFPSPYLLFTNFRQSCLLFGDIVVNLLHDIFVAINVQKIEELADKIHDTVFIEKFYDFCS